LAAAQNRGPLKIFGLKRNIGFISLEPADTHAAIKFTNGLSQVQEFYYGSSFLSQSARFLCTDSSMLSVTIYDSKGNARKVK